MLSATDSEMYHDMFEIHLKIQSELFTETDKLCQLPCICPSESHFSFTKVIQMVCTSLPK